MKLFHSSGPGSVMFICVNAGESEAVVTNREENFGRNLAQNNKKRKQPEITDFLAQKDICKK